MKPSVLSIGLDAPETDAFAADLHAGEGLLRTREFSAVLLDRDAVEPDWRSAVERLAQASPRSCILLVSSVNDEYLWREVVHRGGFDVIVKPLKIDDLRRKLSNAFLYWRTSAVTK